MKNFLFCLLLTLTSHESEAGCKNETDFPLMTPFNESIYLCGVLYQEPGSKHLNSACNGNETILTDETYRYASDPKMFSVGSLIIKAGCKFVGFETEDYKGKEHNINGPIVLPRLRGLIKSTNEGGADGYRSYACYCEIPYIFCVPQDSFRELIVSDNRNSKTEKTENVMVQVGTKFDAEFMKESFFGKVLTEELKEMFFTKVYSELYTSEVTKYDWTMLSNSSKSSDVTQETWKVSVPVGQIVVVEQVVGQCGRTTINTDSVRISFFAKSRNETAMDTKVENVKP